MKLYDLSMTISESMPVYGGDPAVEVIPHREISAGHACNVSRLSFGSHTGTHIDAPKHFIDEGLTCESVPLENFFGTARVLDLRYAMKDKNVLCVEAENLEPYDIKRGEIVLLNIGNGPLDYKPLSAGAAAFLADKKVKTVGIDCLSVEAAGSGDFPVHHILLGAGITVIEGLKFDSVPQDSYLLSALPLKIADGNGSPVRAVLVSGFEPKAVLFDMDGLILDTEYISRECWREAARAQGIEMSDEAFAQLVGRNRESCKRKLDGLYGGKFDLDVSAKSRRERFNKIIAEDGLRVKKGMFNLLDKLSAYGIKTCVATSTDKARAAELLNMAGLGGRFDAIIGGDDVINGKPHPEIFIKAAAAVGAEPGNCLVLEDSPTGAEAAYRGGIRVAVVPDIVRPDAVTRARAYAVCDDLDEVCGLLSSILPQI